MAATIKGINVVIGAETTGLNKALADVNKKSKDIQSELRQVERLLKFNPGNTELLAQKQKLLADQVANTREKLDRLKAAQAQVNEQFRKGEISEGQYRAFQREIVETESKLKHFEKQLASTQKNLVNFGKSMQDAGKKMTDAGKNLSMKVTAPIAGLGAVIAKTGMDFEAAMSEVGAISGATGKDLQDLEALAKEMGSTTKFSASEAADGLKYMAMAGWDTQQMMEGLPGTLNLAAASGEELGAVSDIVTDAMTAFGMEAKRAGEFADTLAAASSSSNTNVGLLGESFKYAAPVAGALGFAAKDTAVALGLMANAGIKGSQSGTALRTMMTNLAKPTDQMKKAMDQYGISLTDADGNMKSLDEVMLNLRESLGGLTEAEQAAAAATIFGKEAMSGALAIVNTSESDYNKLSDAINNSAGAADRMAKEMQDNVKGRLTELKSAVEGVALQLYEAMIPALEKIVAVLQKVVAWFANLSPGMQETIVAVAALVAAIGPLLVVFGLMAQGLGAVVGSVAGVVGWLAKLGPALTFLTGPAGIAVAAIAGITVAGLALKKHLNQEAIPAVNLFGDEVSESTQQAVGGFLELEDKATKSLNQLNWSGQEVTGEMANNITGKFAEMKDQVVGKLEEQKSKSLETLGDMLSESTAMTDEEKENILKITSEKYDKQILTTEEGNNRIAEIMAIAYDENRKLTEEEAKEINRIKEEMKETAVRVLSESELEQLAIMERLRAESGKISALQAADIVKNSKEQMEQTIKNAEEEYQDRLKIAAQLRAEGTAEAEAMADKIVEEAERQKKEAIKHAKEMHLNTIKEAQAQAKEHVNEVNWETGEILTKWESFRVEATVKWQEIRDSASQTWNELKNAVVTKAQETKDNTIAKFEEIWAYIKSIPTQAGQWGANIIEGLWNGISSAGATFKTNLSNWVQSHVPGVFKQVLQIRSPSQVMFEIGSNTVLGFVNGMDSQRDNVVNTGASLGAAAGNAFKDAYQAASSFIETGPPTGSQYEPNPNANVADAISTLGGYKGYLEDNADPNTSASKVRNLAKSVGGMTVNTHFKGDTGVYAAQWDSIMADFAQIVGKDADAINNAIQSGTQVKFFDGLISVSSGFTNKSVKYEDLIKAADGGIATKATLGIWGEAGAEALLPLDMLQPMMADALLGAIKGLQPAQASINYDRIGKAVAKHIRPSVTQYNTFNSPEPLTPSETARQNMRASRQLAMEWGMA